MSRNFKILIWFAVITASTFIISSEVAWAYPRNRIEKIEKQVENIEEQVEEIRKNMVTREEFKQQIEEIRKNMVTREEFKLFVEMVNKRFEDLQRFFSIGIGILGLVQGILIAIITFFGLRILRRLEEIEKRIGVLELKEDIIRDLRERILQDVRKIVNEMIKEGRAG